MKVGILTLHSNTNFGGGLQQIALFEVLKSLGHDPRFLCVENAPCRSSMKRFVGILTSYSPRQLCNAAEEACHRIVDKQVCGRPNWDLSHKTDDFNYSHLNYTPKFGLRELPEYVAGCDALVFGSDQVWTDVYSDILPFFGDGIPDFKGKKIAYAACSVHRRAPIYNRRKLRALLADFDAVSVRDDTSRKLVENYSDTTPPIVCDPTLLYDFGAYIKPSPIEGDYIFAYLLGDKTAEWHRRNLDKIKKQTGLSKVVVLTTELDGDYPWADTVITDALAVDWMNILRASGFVYTNSYHAVLFALKFHRRFVAYYGDLVRSTRMLGLRKQFGLESRIVREPSEVDLTGKLDFTATDSAIKALVKSSMTFLRSAFEKL